MLSDPPCWICVLHECLVLGPLQSKAKSLAPVCSKTCCSLLELERRRNMLTRLMLSDPGFACCTNASRWARESAHQKKKGRPWHAISSCPALRVSGRPMKTPQNCSAAPHKSRRNRLLLFRITSDHGRCPGSDAPCRERGNHLPLFGL